MCENCESLMLRSLLHKHLLFDKMCTCWPQFQQLPAGVNEKEKRGKNTLFRNHNRSLLRRQPRAQELMTAGHKYLGVWLLCKQIKAIVPGNLSGLSSGFSCCSCFVLGIVALVPMQPLPPEVSLVGDSLYKLIIQGPLAAYLHEMAQLQVQ